MKKAFILFFLTIIFCKNYADNLKDIWSEKTQDELEEIIRKVQNQQPRLF